LNKDEYKEYSDKKMPPSTIVKDCIFAFIFGGAICVIGQFLTNIYKPFGLSKELNGSLVSITLIFIGVLLTGLGLYPKLAKYAGAGTIVPITGFANSVASPAIEAKTEGFVLGVSAKIFTIAGPVIVYGIGSSFLVGIWFWIKLFFLDFK